MQMYKIHKTLLCSLSGEFKYFAKIPPPIAESTLNVEIYLCSHDIS